MHLSPLLDEVRRRHDSTSDKARRLFHGRGGCYPGLEAVTVDWFPPVAVITLHAAPPITWLGTLDEGLRTILGRRLGCLLAQFRHLPGTPWQVLHGTVPEPAHAVEAGLRYGLRLGKGQNLGYFPDMIDGRALARRLAKGRRVLNLFAYTCSFSVAALAGGAEQVTNLDMNRGALELGRQNHRDNDLDLRRAAFLSHDLFKSFGKLRRLGPFDLAVVDPPSHQGANFSAHRDWPRLLRHLPSLLAPRAEVVACLNSPHLGPGFLLDGFAEHAPGFSLQEVLPPARDFPDRSPEKGLKVLRFRWEG